MKTPSTPKQALNNFRLLTELSERNSAQRRRKQPAPTAPPEVRTLQNCNCIVLALTEPLCHKARIPMKPFLSTPLLESSARDNAIARYRMKRRIHKRIFLPLAIIATVLFVRCMAIILSH